MMMKEVKCSGLSFVFISWTTAQKWSVWVVCWLYVKGMVRQKYFMWEFEGEWWRVIMSWGRREGGYVHEEEKEEVQSMPWKNIENKASQPQAFFLNVHLSFLHFSLILSIIILPHFLLVYFKIRKKNEKLSS